MTDSIDKREANMMSMAYTKEDTRYLDLLNVMACLAVVQMHTNNCVHRFNVTEGWWMGANVIECICYFAVPTFFMLTGATLLDYSRRYSTMVFFKKRIQKVVLPFLFWSVMGILFSAFVLQSVDLRTEGKRYWYNGIFNTEVVTYYWFFAPLFRAYLSMPLFSAVAPEKKKRVFAYLAVMGYVINALLPLINTLLELELTIPYAVFVVSDNLLFIVVGYLLAKWDFPQKGRKWIYLASLTALTILIVGTWKWSSQAGSTQRVFKDPSISIPYAAGIFLLAKTYGNRIMDSFIGKIVHFLKKYTFSIYLLQWFVIQSMKNFLIIDDTSLIYRLGAVPVVVAVCVGVTILIRKIPLLRRTLP